MGEMMFPFSFSRTIKVPVTNGAIESTSEMIVSMLAKRIETEKPKNITSTQDRITFSSGIFRFRASWDLLGPISYGEIDITQTSNKILVSYKLWFVELFVIVSLMVTIMAFSIFTKGFTIQTLVLIAVMWLWLFGGNFLLTVIRFDNLIHSVLKK